MLKFFTDYKEDGITLRDATQLLNWCVHQEYKGLAMELEMVNVNAIHGKERVYRVVMPYYTDVFGYFSVGLYVTNDMLESGIDTAAIWARLDVLLTNQYIDHLVMQSKYQPAEE